MKTYCSRIIVKPKQEIQNIKGHRLKENISKLFEIENLSCNIGSFYCFKFNAKNQVEALHLVERISKELLINEDTEEYEIKCLDECQTFD